MPQIKPLQAGIMTNDQKKKLCEKHTQCPKMKQSDLAKWAKHTFNLLKIPGQTTISDILKKKENYLGMSSAELSLRA
ncbi:uncharacterized protein MELLADRAFT_95147 [Melampsora larici-populina 98AG31]|uniref:ARS-binding protein 1 N-terminal domain-containing protein n=1 Tax=Melampsora larici-populina (strain 98AG31 / pathotype 3-4-7) TaxID=747676 RepID=F4RCA1_MELLP|nr:uncharacterized protein MELLADRAFT_95147 [Melampsora larici-populina 98AG31]EGG09988.1 hypothetical protein MELLADRAFT_95147 [Melampsora larici-populina 98AG31]